MMLNALPTMNLNPYAKFTQKIKIFTSISPNIQRMFGKKNIGVQYQMECIKSWVAAGFEVISLNHNDELAGLKQAGYPVRYIGLPASYKVPTISDVLKHVSASDGVAGIVNADCKLEAVPHFHEIIGREAHGSCIVLERTDLNIETGRPTGGSCIGFDAFFFDTAHTRDLYLPPVCAFGQTWWDYWLPMELMSRGLTLKASKYPVLTHIDHPKAWSQASFMRNGALFIDHFYGPKGRVPASMHKILERPLGANLSSDELRQLSRNIYERIRALAKDNEFDWIDTWISTIELQGTAAHQSREFVVAARNALHMLQSENDAIKLSRRKRKASLWKRTLTRMRSLDFGGWRSTLYGGLETPTARTKRHPARFSKGHRAAAE